MTDLEGIANKMFELNRPEDEIMDMLMRCYGIFKPSLGDSALSRLASSILHEVKASRVVPASSMVTQVLELDPVNLTTGEQGVGCRGMGDFIAHEYITRLASTVPASYLSPASMDDAGAVVLDDSPKNRFIVSKMEGMHSRLSNFPFIAAFHVTRACLRDLLVKGARPVSIMVDIHLGDDCDLIKLFDFMAGVAAVAELAGVPITAGSTLRIGGDMVIGNRITGGIAGIGTCETVLARKNISLPCDVIMTEGAGGGTVATTAIYSGKPDTLIHTLNVKFIHAMKALLETPVLLEGTYCCSDVTNGGLRGDMYEILKEPGLGAKLEEQAIANLVHPDIKQLLEDTGTDYLGVSLDALLVFCTPDVTTSMIDTLQKRGIRACKIGHCTAAGTVDLARADGSVISLVPRFREAAYTPVKKIIGEHLVDRDPGELERLVKLAFDRSTRKKEAVVHHVEQQHEGASDDFQ